MPTKKVMIIDDDAEMSKLLAKQLNRSGYTCHSAKSVAEGLQILRRFHPDVVILDLMMEKVSGSAFLSSAKNWLEDRHKIPPTIVLSGLDDPDITEFVLQMGAKRYFTKPYNSQQLLHAIEECLHERNYDTKTYSHH